VLTNSVVLAVFTGSVDGGISGSNFTVVTPGGFAARGAPPSVSPREASTSLIS